MRSSAIPHRQSPEGLPGVARETALFLLAGGLLSVLLLRAGPLDGEDPLRTTLAALPLAVVGLWLLRRSVSRCGGRLPAPAWRAGEGIGVAILTLLILSRRLAGLDLADPLVVAFGLVLLGAHLARQVLAMRPLLGKRLPRSPSAHFLLLPLLVYLAVLPWSSEQRAPDGDEPWYLLLTHSIAYDLDIDLANNYAASDWQHFLDREIEPQPGDPRGRQGQIYSRHNALLPLVLALPYRLAGKAGALASMAVLAAALAWMTLRLAHHYLPDHPAPALLAWALVAFGPPLVLYSQQVWVEVPAALLTALALDRIQTLVDDAWPAPRDWLSCCVLLVLLPVLKLRFALLAGPLFLLGLWHLVRRRRQVPVGAVLLACGGLALGAGALLLYNSQVYGNVLKMHSLGEMALHRLPAGLYLNRFLGLFWDCAFGLFSSAPLWLLLIPAILHAAARRPALLGDAALLTLPYLLAVASRNEWYGGWSPPFRYGLVTLPLLGLVLAPLLAHRRGGGARALFAALAAATAALSLVWLVVPGWTYNFADGRSLLIDQLSRRLQADLLRFFPSAVHPRVATWVWPPVTALVVTVGWWLPRRRLRHAAAGGVLLVLAMAALLPTLALTLPTRSVELEAAQVEKLGGHPFPRRWIIERSRYRESWVLREAESLRVPIVAGSSRVELVLHSRFLRRRPGRLELEVRAGERLLATVRLDPSERWSEHRTGPLSWPPGARLLTLSLPPPDLPGRRNGVVLDRIDLLWQ